MFFFFFWIVLFTFMPDISGDWSHMAWNRLWGRQRQD
jgi:hypothetical protein